ncbi:hypothetical protein GCM10029976_071140 [Kribbella albertanoniae]|uniref:hypothetical protein n=1 Tax=Kribbella albertanoniae TaxID=1266829 RepID=UPI001404A350|nr:hypothetical protein [Kribbella albertanoniae]
MSESNFDSAAEWAEHDMTLRADSPSALRGPAAAAFGRDLVERASNGEPAIDPHADSQH